MISLSYVLVKISRSYGVIIEGTSAVNESALTGESIPVDKAAGDLSFRRNRQPVRILSNVEATRVGEDTTLSLDHQNGK